MRIAIYVGAWPPGTAPTGIVTYAAQLVPALRRLGHEVFVLTLNAEAGSDDPHTVDLRRFMPAPTLWSRALSRISVASSAFRTMSRAIASAIDHLVEKHGVQVFEMEDSFGWTLETSRRRAVPVVVRLHGPWFMTGKFNDPGDRGPFNRGRAEMEGRGILAAHFVTANCLDTLSRVRKHYGAEIQNSRIVPTPLDAADGRLAWNIDRCQKDTILFVGRFDRLKGADLVLRAFQRLAATHPRLKLTFVGPDHGIVNDDGTTSKFEEYVARSLPASIRPRIDFRGRMDHAGVMSIRASHYMTVIAAQFDTFGYMLLEPMSLGCPLVSTAVGGIPEVIQDRCNGLLVPSQDDDAMVAACTTLLEDQALAARIGRQAREDCQRKYDSQKVASQMIDAYQEAIDTFRR
jgi:glycosyltransferase involved in cell wall biosynthesis